MRRWVLMILAVVLYNSWLAWPLNGSPDALLAYISELAAADQPFSWFFRAADAAAATVYGVIAFLGWHGWTRWLGRRHSRHVSLALLTVAAGTMLDVSFNLPCAESRDVACAAMPSIKRHLHEVASVIVSAGQVACIALVAWTRARRGWTRAVRAMTGLAAVVAAGSATWHGNCLPAMPEARPGEYTIHRRPGGGRAVVLLNGCGLAAVAWDQVVSELSGHAVIAIDRPGRCGTTCTELPHLRRETLHLAQTIADDAPVIVVAHSMAAFQAEALARLRPDSTAGIVLVDPSVEAQPGFGPLRRAAAVRIARLAATVLRVELIRRLIAEAVRAGMRRETHHPEVMADESWRAGHETSQALAAAVAEFLAYGEQAVDLARLRHEQRTPVIAPTILLEGQDGYSRQQRESLRGAFARLEVRRLPASRHLMMLDAPEEIARAVFDLDREIEARL